MTRVLYCVACGQSYESNSGSFCHRCGAPLSQPPDDRESPRVAAARPSRSESFNNTIDLIEAIAERDNDRVGTLSRALTERGDVVDILQAVTAVGALLKRSANPEATAAKVTAALETFAIGSDKQKAAAKELGRAALIDADARSVVRYAIEQRSADGLNEAENGENLRVLIKSAGLVARALDVPVNLCGTGPTERTTHANQVPAPPAPPAAVRAANTIAPPRNAIAVPTPTPPAQTRPAAPPRRPQPASAYPRRTRKSGNPAWRMVKTLLALAGLALLGGGWAYGHSTTFKVECLGQKLGIAQMSFPKNIICDADFDLKTR